MPYTVTVRCAETDHVLDTVTCPDLPTPGSHRALRGERSRPGRRTTRGGMLHVALEGGGNTVDVVGVCRAGPVSVGSGSNGPR